MSWPPGEQSMVSVWSGSRLTIVTRVPSSTTSTFGKRPFGVTVKVAGGKIGVPSASVPAAQMALPAFEYIARSTTSCGSWLGVGPDAFDQDREAAALGDGVAVVDVEAAVGRDGVGAIERLALVLEVAPRTRTVAVNAEVLAISTKVWLARGAADFAVGQRPRRRRDDGAGAVVRLGPVAVRPPHRALDDDRARPR